ncbi:hypothetical protein [Cerasicoccus maritimus]|uniref:hypothetical protein n=1 Tax=Cerasicoccus maritimus TaxID=490089 RepID=UPI002852D5BC|nr:hypothetical protein [Cerasicoccus maritimus]
MIDQKQYLAVKLGIDVHADSYVVVRQVDGSTPQTSQKFRTRESFLRFVSKQQSEAEQVYACYEAGPFGYGLHRQLLSMGVTNYVVAPQDWDEQGRGVKSDSLST